MQKFEYLFMKNEYVMEMESWSWDNFMESWNIC